MARRKRKVYFPAYIEIECESCGHVLPLAKRFTRCPECRMSAGCRLTARHTAAYKAWRAAVARGADTVPFDQDAAVQHAQDQLDASVNAGGCPRCARGIHCIAHYNTGAPSLKAQRVKKKRLTVSPLRVCLLT